MELKKEDKNSPTILGKDSLIESAEKIIAKNLQNTEFDIQNLSTYLNVSSNTLHPKIKKSTNQNPSEFIRDIRLNNALDLLKAGKFNIDEIGAYVGFNSTSYFIRSFKKKFLRGRLRLQISRALLLILIMRIFGAAMRRRCISSTSPCPTGNCAIGTSINRRWWTAQRTFTTDLCCASRWRGRASESVSATGRKSIRT